MDNVILKRYQSSGVNYY